MQTNVAVDARTKANAERFEAIARIFDSAKTSRCELVLSGLNIDGDPREPFAAIADRLRGVEQPPSTDHWPAHLRALLDIAHTLASALQSMLDEDDGGLAAGPARADLEQVRGWFARSAYQSEGIVPVASVDGVSSEAEPQAAAPEAAPPPAAEADQWEIRRKRKEQIQAVLHLDGWREGSRAIGHDGPELNRWEDYVEVPVDVLLRLARLVEADLAYNAAEQAYAEAKRAKGNYNPNPLPASHPLSHARRAATIERHEALAPFQPAAKEEAS